MDFRVDGYFQYCALVSASQFGAREDFPLEISVMFGRITGDAGEPHDGYMGKVWIRREMGDIKCFICESRAEHVSEEEAAGEMFRSVLEDPALREMIRSLVPKVKTPVLDVPPSDLLQGTSAAAGSWKPGAPVRDARFFPQFYYNTMMEPAKLPFPLKKRVEISGSYVLDPATNEYCHEVWARREEDPVQTRVAVLRTARDGEPIKDVLSVVLNDSQFWSRVQEITTTWEELEKSEGLPVRTGAAQRRMTHGKGARRRRKKR